MWHVVVLSGLLAVVAGQSTSVSQCLSNEGDLPINTLVEGCDTPPCLLPQLQNVVLHIVFRAPRTMTTMRTLVTAYMSLGLITVPIPYDLGDEAITCNFLANTYCPVLATEVVQYTLRMFIESIFPVGTAVTLEFRVVDTSTATQQPILCIRVPIRIVEPVAGAGAARITATNGTLATL